MCRCDLGHVHLHDTQAIISSPLGTVIGSNGCSVSTRVYTLVYSTHEPSQPFKCIYRTVSLLCSKTSQCPDLQWGPKAPSGQAKPPAPALGCSSALVHPALQKHPLSPSCSNASTCPCLRASKHGFLPPLMPSPSCSSSVHVIFTSQIVNSKKPFLFHN